MENDTRPPGIVRQLAGLVTNILILVSAALMAVSVRSSLFAYATSSEHALHHEITWLLMDSLLFLAMALLSITLWAWLQKKILGAVPWINTEFILPGGSASALADLALLILLIAVLKPFFHAEVFYGLWHDPALPVQTVEPAMLPKSGWLSVPGALILVIGCLAALRILAAATRPVNTKEKET